VPTTFVHDLAGRLVCQKCKEAGKRPAAPLLQLAPRQRHTPAGEFVFARIGIMRALNRHVERVFNPSRKETRWGRHKLARDR